MALYRPRLLELSETALPALEISRTPSEMDLACASPRARCRSPRRASVSLFCRGFSVSRLRDNHAGEGGLQNLADLAKLVFGEAFEAWAKRQSAGMTGGHSG